MALDRQGTQQQRPEAPTVTPPGVRVNARYTNSTNGISSSYVCLFCSLSWEYSMHTGSKKVKQHLKRNQ